MIGKLTEVLSFYKNTYFLFYVIPLENHTKEKQSIPKLYMRIGFVSTLNMF